MMKVAVLAAGVLVLLLFLLFLPLFGLRRGGRDDEG
jgi:hypothetical protein